MDTTSNHYKGKFRNIYAVHAEFPNGGAAGDFVDIGGFAHYWNEDRGTWSVNENRDQYWDEKFAGVDNEIDGLKKADETLRTEIGKKADKSYVDTELGKKADKTYVDGKIGDLEDLNTPTRTNLVDAINEAYNHGGSEEGGIPEAPKDGKSYARKDGVWVSLRDLKSISETDGGITTLLKNYFVRMENQEGDFFEVGEEEGAMMSVDEGNVQMTADSGGIHFIIPENAKFELNGKPIGSNEDLEKQVDNLQTAVDEIIAGNITFTAGASPNVIFVGSSTPATITATASKECDIVIKQGSTVLKSGSNVKTLSVTTAGLSNTTSYTAEFTFKGKTTTKTATVTAVGPIYYGSGAVYTDVTNDGHKYGTATTSPARTYAVNVASNGQKVFFVVPSTMTINKATLSGFDFPLTMSEQVIDGVRYKVYTSDNTYDAGTINIVIS